MEIGNIKSILEILSHIITILGFPIAIYVLIQEKLKERRAREYGTYTALDDKYIEFLKICLENPALDIYHLEKKEPHAYTQEQKTKEIVVFEILISILERAYLMYSEHSTKIKKEQWEGWNMYMYEWMRRENFRDAWRQLGHQWEINFENHMNAIYDELNRNTNQV